ncbi:MAG: metallophosphoesterase family protein [bacterium]
MQYGIISDIHGNLEALLAVIPYLSKVDKTIVLGDIVGYGPCPNECCEYVRKLNPLVIAGNHDIAAVGKKDINWFNPYAREAIEWTQRNLSSENKEWLLSLPLRGKQSNFIFVHGSLRDYTDEYIFKEKEAGESLGLLKDEILFIGHTHVPSCFFVENNSIQGKYLMEDEVIKLKKRSIINPGSVGQPRDYIPKASFGIVNNKEFKLFRIPYNIKRTQRLMRQVGLPEYLIKRLENGR